MTKSILVQRMISLNEHVPPGAYKYQTHKLIFLILMLIK